MTQIALLSALLLCIFAGAAWARGTTVGVGETVPLGGTTTTTTTTTDDTTPATPDEEPSEPTPQVLITPADGSTPSSTEGSSWENLGMIGGGDSTENETAGTTTAPENGQPMPDGNGEARTGNSCAPALVLAGLALALFVSRK